MYDVCLDNFLVKSRPSYVERHSDSSEFENSCNVSFAGPKDGTNHSQLKIKTRKKRKKDMIARHRCNNFQLYNISTQYSPEMKMYTRKQVLCRDKSVDCASNYNIMEGMRGSSKANIDQSSQFKEKYCSISLARNNIVPSLPTMLKGCYNNCSTHGDNNVYSAYCERHRIKKLSKPRGNHTGQPMCAVAKDITSFPFQRTNDCVQLSQIDTSRRNNFSDNSYEYSLSSDSEKVDIIKPYKHKKLMKYIINKIEKRIRREYPNVETIKNQKQQYPSKLELKATCQTLSCQTKSVSSNSVGLGKMPSNSSEFWDFLLHKIKYQIHQAEVSKDKGDNTIKACNTESCQFLSNADTNKLKSPVKGSKDISDSLKKSEHSCKCPKNEDKSQEGIKPCQDPHDAITKQLGLKYKGEILCIHNPPCVLINGCLNLPPPKVSTPQGQHFYPVTQSKMSSFAQMCRKITRSRHKTIDQAIQYQPSIEIQEYLPEFKMEKNIQSVCHHNPPCEMVRGCHKPKYCPTLPTSCVHVPMCPKFPECLLDQRNIDSATCDHTPKCADLPLCTRKHIVLTTKEHVSTQVKPKTKIGCRHQPPCLMIPKCLAQAIYDDWLPGSNVPGCVHQPSCEMIPACCRTKLKESVSAPSQYPSASCPIV